MDLSFYHCAVSTVIWETICHHSAKARKTKRSEKRKNAEIQRNLIIEEIGIETEAKRVDRTGAY